MNRTLSLRLHTKKPLPDHTSKLDATVCVSANTQGGQQRLCLFRGSSDGTLYHPTPFCAGGSDCLQTVLTGTVLVTLSVTEEPVSSHILRRHARSAEP